MIDQMYLQTGMFNAVLVLIVLHRVYEERNQFRDCKLFARLLTAVFLVIMMDTAGWLLEGKFLGDLRIITNLVDGFNLILTAAVCWCWVQYAQYLAYEDAGIPGYKNYFSSFLFGFHAVAILAAIPTRLFYYIDDAGHYVRSTGYSLTITFCLAQLVYSILICMTTRKKIASKAKRRELLLVALIILLPIAATIVQGFIFGTSVIWTCMTIVLLVIYIHIQDKRRESENAEQQEQLRLALQQAQYASKAKTDFLSNMSHDIRTPMNAIVGFTAIAASHIDEKNIVQDSLTKIMSSSNHLLNLINDVLDMSRIESGKMHLQVAPCNLAVIMHDLVDMIQSQIRANQLELFVDTLHVKDENILTDAMKLNQIFINLVGNAIKFNKPGGVISIRIEQKESATAGIANYVFTVKDTGCGIAGEYLNHIFEPFERGVQDAAKDSVEGTGLGLAIVKNIVDMMGGTISVSSEVGKGTEFIVGLSFGLQTKQEADMNYEKLRGLRALVADDDYNTCDSVTTMLHEIGMNAEWTLTGKEAVLKAKKASEIHKGYAAFIIDWLMPDMNGIEVTRRIRSVIGQETPIFILTAYDWSDLEQEAKEAGVTAFCRKPLFMSELRQTLMESSGVVQAEPRLRYEDTMYEKLSGKRILLAEDHPLNREIAVRLLTDKGLKVEEAEDGRIAVEKFNLSRGHYYDLILMDIRMPNLDGYQAADAIRGLDREDAKSIPIIAMTANAFEEDKQMAIEHGMNEHLAKPLNVKLLFETMGKYLNCMLLCLIFVIFSASPVCAEETAGQAITFSAEEQEYINSHDTIAAALSTDLSPMEFYDEEKGMFEGFTVKYFELLSKTTGLKFQYVPREDIDTLKKQGEDQEIQMVGIIAVNGAANQIHAEETDSPYSNTLSLIYKTSHENDVKKDSIGIMAGYPYFKQTAQDLGYQNIREYATARDCALAVKQGKVDAAMVSTVAVYMILNHAFFDNLTSMELAETKMAYCFGVFESEDSQTLLSIINKGIRALPEEEVKNARMSALMSYQAEPTLMDRIYENKVLFLFIGFLIILAIVMMLARMKSREQTKEIQRFFTYVCHANKYVLEYDLKNRIRTEYFFQENKLCHKTAPLLLVQELETMILLEDYENWKEALKEENLRKLVKEEKELVFEARLKHHSEGFNWYIITLNGMKQDRKHPCSFMCFIRDIQKLKDQEEKNRQTLTDALKQAENASRAKGDFMSRMSHEIRTPLNAIIGYLEIARDEKEDLEKIDYCMEKSQVASRHLLSIINDVLDISSIESGRMKIAHEDFDLKQMVNSLTILFFSQAKEKGISFEVHLDLLELEWLCGDELRVRQVLLNLLSNAVKFTPTGGSIFLNISQMESLGQDSDKIRLKFEVQDTGIGMSKEYKERMFTPFEQESASTARNYGGTGLGLSISHNLVRMMGGDIQVESEQGKGTTFTVILAFDPPKSRPEEHLATESFKELKALVVDDEPDTCNYMKKLFDRLGMQCDTVTSGKKALRRVTSRLDSAHPYDLCIIDWYMEEMDGVETAREVRQLCGDEIPIIIATAYDYSAILEEAKEAGVNKIISKPLFQSTIMNLLVTNFGKYQPEKQKEKVNIDFTGTRLLLAEDNEMNMEIALDILRKAGFVVTPVNNGQEAYDTFTSADPGTFDAILMDIQMPVMDGYTATRKIRESEHPEAKSIPVIAMTANAFTEDVTAALAAGMNDHVAKPISYDRLFHVLSRLVKQSEK